MHSLLRQTNINTHLYNKVDCIIATTAEEQIVRGVQKRKETSNLTSEVWKVSQRRWQWSWTFTNQICRNRNNLWVTEQYDLPKSRIGSVSILPAASHPSFENHQGHMLYCKVQIFLFSALFCSNTWEWGGERNDPFPPSFQIILYLNSHYWRLSW